MRADRGIKTPDGLGLELTIDDRGRPVPGYEFFTIVLMNCRGLVRKLEGEG